MTTPTPQPPPPCWVRARAYIEWTFLRWRTPPRPTAVELHPHPSDEALAALRGPNPPVAKIDRALIPPRTAATPRHPLGYTVEIAPTRDHRWTWLVRHPRTGITVYTGVEYTEAEAIRQATRPWVNR